MTHTHSRLPFLATLVAIALYSVMDATMKHASLAVGAYNATLWRCVIGSVLILPLWLHEGARWPERAVLVVHVKRGVVGAGTALTFFLGLVRLPLAEAIAISFIAPLIALFLAAVLLGEKIGKPAIGASVLGLAGVLVIALLRTETGGSQESSAIGIGLVLVSSLLYAWNLILQRQQALVAGPREVAVFQTSVAALVLALPAPWLAVVPDAAAGGWIVASAALAMVAVMLSSWAYGRAEAQALVPIEYTAFLWAALFGWIAFGETLTAPTVGGALLIVAGCWIAAPRKRVEHIEQTAL
jgi:S-adenosylmethionine uptake transporter